MARGFIRPASPADAEALLSVYAQYIDTAITFEYALPSAEAFRDRIRDTLAEYPYLVWEEEGRALGYAYAHRLREREAYRWSAELSVYVDERAQGAGIGRALYEALIRLLAAQGVKTAYGCVTLPNEKSAALHESLGFAAAGVFRRAGYKAGAWHDVIWYEKAIAPYDDPPAPPRLFSEMQNDRKEAGTV